MILGRTVDDAAALASSTVLPSVVRSPRFPNAQAASLAWAFGKRSVMLARHYNRLHQPPNKCTKPPHKPCGSQPRSPYVARRYAPALYLRGFCFGLLPECPRWQFPISQWRVTLAGLARGYPEPPPHSPTDGWRLPLPRASLLLLRWPSSRATRSAPTLRRPLGPPSPASSAPVGPPSPLSGAPPCFAGERLCPFFSAGALSVK